MKEIIVFLLIISSFVYAGHFGWLQCCNGGWEMCNQCSYFRSTGGGVHKEYDYFPNCNANGACIHFSPSLTTMRPENYHSDEGN